MDDGRLGTADGDNEQACGRWTGSYRCCRGIEGMMCGAKWSGRRRWQQVVEMGQMMRKMGERWMERRSALQVILTGQTTKQGVELDGRRENGEKQGYTREKKKTSQQIGKRELAYNRGIFIAVPVPISAQESDSQLSCASSQRPQLVPDVSRAFRGELGRTAAA